MLYHETKLGKLFKGGCLEVMDELIKEGVKVDAIITDPPYGTTKCKWDVVIPFEVMWKKLWLLRKDDTPIALFGSEPFSSFLRLSNIKEYKYDWVWEKDKPTNFMVANKQPMKYYEFIHMFYKKQPTYNKQMIPRSEGGKSRNKYKPSERTKSDHYYLKNNVLKYDENLKNPSLNIKFNSVYRNTILHNTQKPIALIEYLIKTYSNEGDLVLDFTSGSGTLAVACEHLNRRWICIEKDEDSEGNSLGYCDITVDRLKELK